MAEAVEYNLFARFRFMNQPGVGQMKQTAGTFASLHRNAKMARAGVQQMARGFRTLSMFGAGAIAVLGGVVKRGMEFGKAWADARSVLRGAPKDITALEKYAKTLGATTLFTAGQAAKGMEELARAGLDAKGVHAAIRPVLKLSVADNIDMASASKLAARAVNVFKDQMLTFGQVTDHFAYVSKNSATNTTELGEAFKFAAPAARLAKQNFSELMGTLGLLAQAGYTGSLAGTAYKNAVVKLAKGGEAANKVFGGRQAFLNAVTDKKTGKWKSFADIMRLTMGRLGKIKNQAERAGLAFKLFGIRGIATFGAFTEGGAKDYERLITKIKEGSVGTAEAMAKMKQESLHGQWLLFKSALDGVALSIYKVIKPGVMAAVQQSATVLSKFAAAISAVGDGASETKIIEKYGKVVADVIFGVKEGVQEAWQVVKQLGRTVIGVFQTFSGGSKYTRKDIIKLVAKIGGLIVILTPIAGIIGVIGIAAGGMFNIVSGGFKVINALTSRWGLVLMAVVYAFSGGQKKGESFFTTMTRGLKNVISLANKLLWPFKMLAKHLGTIPALMAGLVAYKGGKALLGRAGSALSGSRNPLARMLGGVAGAAGRAGMPVYVTNFGEMPAGGIGGGGIPGMGGAGAAGRMGMFGRMGAAARYAGMSLPAMAFGGKFVGGGAMAGGTALGKSAAFVSGLGTAGVALGAFAAALAPAVAGVYAIGKAYDPAEQAKYRDKILGPWRKKQAAARMKQQSEDERRKKLGLGPKFLSLDYLKTETFQQAALRKKIGESGVNLSHSRQLQAGVKMARGGDIWGARGALANVGMSKFQATFAKMSDYDLKLYGLNREQIDVLKAIAKASSGTIDAISRGWSTTINLDGRQIAIVTAHNKQNANERSGRPVESGARSRAIRTGTS